MTHHIDRPEKPSWCPIVTAAMLFNIFTAFGLLLAFPSLNDDRRGILFMAFGAFAVFAISLFGVRKTVDYCWERIILIAGGGAILTLFWLLLMVVLIFTYAGLSKTPIL